MQHDPLEDTAMTEQSPSFALTRPAHVGRAHLVVRDLETTGQFYQSMLGLKTIEKSESGITLGAGDTPLLTLTTSSDVAQAPRSAAGLFHNAFLMPNRRELAHWLAHAVNLGVQLQGASDHLVSEAIYLADPEGNGIEVYADRPVRDWAFHPDGTVEMATLRLDLQALYDSAPKGAWTGMDDGAAIGHIHLQVGNIPAADKFYEGVLGLKKMATYPGASFFGSGTYHHHVAANIWNSRGAPERTGQMSGLQGYSIHFNDKEALETALKTLDEMEIAVERTAEGHALKDPWSIGVTLSA
ncbi:VOC family protein [Ciceribacter sp. L1K23]|uniref:VOC family protein n=1 Tax=Ciceribacter sp. L1K23 TaxID=2820276 RepID=UPI002010FCF6|nr:VOC family protein [Ciceribacter sp. L1K23]